MKNTTRHTDERIGGLASAKTVHGEPRHKRLFLGGMVALGALLAACGSHTFEISGSGGHSVQVSSGLLSIGVAVSNHLRSARAARSNDALVRWADGSLR